MASNLPPGCGPLPGESAADMDAEAMGNALYEIIEKHLGPEDKIPGDVDALTEDLMEFIGSECRKTISDYQAEAAMAKEEEKAAEQAERYWQEQSGNNQACDEKGLDALIERLMQRQAEYVENHLAMPHDHDALAAADAIQSLRQFCTWQSIETAQKDGSDVWLGAPGRRVIAYWGQLDKIGPRGGNQRVWTWISKMGPTPYEDEFEIDFEPTHWMPTPEPPQQDRCQPCRDLNIHLNRPLPCPIHTERGND